MSVVESTHRGNETNSFGCRNAIAPLGIGIEISEKSGHRLATNRFELLQ